MTNVVSPNPNPNPSPSPNPNPNYCLYRCYVVDDVIDDVMSIMIPLTLALTLALALILALTLTIPQCTQRDVTECNLCVTQTSGAPYLLSYLLTY